MNEGKNKVVFLKQEYLDKVEALKDKEITLAEIVRTGIDLYYNAEFKGVEVPEGLIEKVKGLIG